MKFRKEYQTYLLIVIAIITAGYFLKHFFFNKKKKVIEGQAGTTTTYYRIAFSSTDLIDTSKLTPTDQDLLKELILMEYDASKIITDDTTSKYVKPDVKYDSVIGLIPDTLLIKDAAGAVLGFKVVSICGRLAYFKYQAAAAADTAPSSSTCNYTACNGQILSYINKVWRYTSSDFGECTGCPVVSYASTLPTAAATAAAAAYDYARLILSNEKAYKADVNIMALIAAANLLTILGQPEYDEAVVKTAKTAALAADNANDAAKDAALAAAFANDAAEDAAAGYAVAAAEAAAKAANYADAYAKGLSLNFTTATSNGKVMTKYNNDPANLKAAFITAAGLIYQSVYTHASLLRPISDAAAG